MPYAIDLFCGAGGMSEGIIQAGFHILFSSDINEDVQKTYINRHEQLGLKQGYNTHFHRCDVRDLTKDLILDSINNLKIFEKTSAPKEIDTIFGGPPCQGFSRAGRRNPNDPRNMLFREYLRIINDIRPKYVVFENVTGFIDTKFFGFQGITGTKYEDGSTVPNILRAEFDLIGYHTLEPKILDAANFGVPQRRNRIIVIAYRKDMIAPQYPEPTNATDEKLSIADAISDLIRDDNVKDSVHSKLTEYQKQSRKGRTPNIDGKVINSEGNMVNNELSRHLPIVAERFSLFREGEDGEQLRNRVKNEGIDITDKPALIYHCSTLLKLHTNEVIQKFGAADIDDNMIDALLTKKSIRTRLDRHKPSATVMTIADDYISPFESRTFTVRELARLQSFDDSFIFLGKRTTGGIRRRVEVPQYSQVGNAVPPLLARAIAEEIKKVINAGI